MTDHEMYMKICDIQPELTRTQDDRGFSQIYAELFSKELRHNTSTKCWMVYEDGRWQEDPGCTKASLLARDMAGLIGLYGSRIEDENRREMFCKAALKYGSLKYRETLVRDAAPLMAVTMADFDQSTNLLNFRNCTLDLQTLQPHEHRPQDMLTKMCGCEYTPGAFSARWDSFIREIMCEDVAKIQYLQRISGLFLTSDISLEAAFVLYGSTTRNGKTTFVSTLARALGDYSETIQPETLAQTKNRSGGAASPDIAKLAGIRFLSMSEPPKRMLLDVSLFKQLTGGDTITARNLYQRPFCFRPEFKLLINCNSLPVVTDDTLFSSDRVRIITFDRHFEAQERNPHLKQELQSPEVLPAVINWCLAGLKAFRKIGERPPECVLQATQAYERKSDKITQFLEDRLTPSEQNISGAAVYTEFCDWCKSAGYTAEGKGKFFDVFRKRGLLAKTGTVDGKTVKNVVIGYEIL